MPDLCGKTIRRNGFDTITVEPGTPKAPMKLNMCTDIMYVNRKPFLLLGFTPINLTQYTYIHRNPPESPGGEWILQA